MKKILCFIILLDWQGNYLFAQQASNTYPPLAPIGPLRITYPIERMVFQRDNSANGGKDTVTITGEVLGTNFVSRNVAYRITRLDPQTGYTYGCPSGASCPVDLGISCDTYGCAVSGYTNFSKTSIDNTTATFRLDTELPMGFYIVQVMITKPFYNPTIGGFQNQSIAYQHKLFSVGDNFVIGGQSNSRGQETFSFNRINNAPYAPNDDPNNSDIDLIPIYTGYNASSLLPEAVSVINNYSSQADEGQGVSIGGLPFYTQFSKLTNQVFNIYPIGRYSWAYAPLGKKIIEQTGVPTAFFNAGYGNQGVSDFTGSFGGTAPYLVLRNTLQSYASILGTRGILWMQGERDNAIGTSQAAYSAGLNLIIDQTRTDFGNTNLAWTVSRTSLSRICTSGVVCTDNNTSAAVIAGQNDVIANGTSVFAGPTTDDLLYTTGSDNQRGPTYRTHFHDVAHLTVGERWNTANLQQATPMKGKPILPLTVMKTGSQYQLSAPAGYATYIWSKNDEGIYHSTVLNKFSQTITVPYSTNPDIYVCYVSHDTDYDQATNGWNLKLQVTAPFVIPNTADGQKLLMVSNNTLNYVNTSATAQAITVSSANVVWLPDNNSTSWIHFNNTIGGGQGDTPLTISVDDNNTGNGRTANILVQEENGGLFQTITIAQGVVNPCGDYNIQISPYNDYYSGIITQKASIAVSASNKILNYGTIVKYQAGQSILLSTGTFIGNGATFKAEILPCY